MELISIFCNTKVKKDYGFQIKKEKYSSLFNLFKKEKAKAEQIKNEAGLSETTSENSSSLILNNVQTKDNILNPVQELKLINLILKSIKVFKKKLL